MPRRSPRPAPRSRASSNRPSRGPEGFPKTAARRPLPISRKPEREPSLAAPASSARETTHVAPVGLLAEATVEIALTVEREVLSEGKRADQVLSILLRRRRDLAIPDHRFISSVTFALFRW